MWNDPVIGIKWPVPEGEEPKLAEKDKKYPGFSEDIFLEY